ncbi:MFS transporter [Micromonospora sp. DR5-3]|uniref:MFS transporter n=1 Tax=unclassified Micromonospora TaxID=2617518 RepID=UPI0011D924B6|nr:MULTISPECIES: MFS transporter [unclassified Micromonospora]MCW3815898.1 MFS transporter [Micromonospora sp. DR5-3]TYC24408.1 MFS transporter [Micromonospora sp. MP36]
MRPRDSVRAAGWPWALLLHTVLLQSVTFLLRPTTSYRALELGVPAAWLGVISASFAVLPLLAAVLIGRATDRHGERPALLAGALLVLVAAAGLTAFADALTGLVLWSAVLGLGHLFSVVGQQAWVARSTVDAGLDIAFGRYTFAVSLGQAVGPVLITVLGGGGLVPDTERVFAGALAGAGALLATGLLLRPRPQPSAAGRPGRGDRMGTVLRMPGLGRAILASLTVLAAVDLLVIYLPALGAEQGIAARVIGVLLALRAGASMVSRLFLGALVERMSRMRLLVGSIAASAVAVAVLAVPLPLWALGVAVVAAGLGLGIGQPLTMSWITLAAPPGARATALALRLSGNRLGQLVVPAGVGLVAASAGVAGVLLTTAVALGAVAVSTARGSPGR